MIVLEDEPSRGVRMEWLTPPEALDLNRSNLADSWQQQRPCFELFLLANGLSSKNAKIHSATLLHVIGPATLKVYNSFTLESTNDKQKVKLILAKFEAYCILRTNITWERQMFNTCNQCDNETINQYITDLRRKA